MKKQKKNENILRHPRGRRSIFNFIFGKTTFLVLVILAELAVVALFFIYLGNYIPVLITIMALTAVSTFIYLISVPTSPEAKLSWIAIVLLFPIIGAVTYIWVHTDPSASTAKKRAKFVDEQTKKYEKPNDDAVFDASLEEYGGTAAYLKKAGGYGTYRGTEVCYYSSGEAFFDAVIDELEKAEKFIFLEFFIIAYGEMWSKILEILLKKANEGVEVRVLYDGSCVIWRLPYEYPKRLEELGIKCKMFSPLRPFISTSYNNRDHRKIVVIDGRVAFTGGSNVADEYVNITHPYGYWKDASVKLCGDAVNEMSLMFLKMWDIDERESDFEYGKYLCAKAREDAIGSVVPYGDVPVYSERLGEFVYIDIINRAEKYVYMMSPYLILDGKMTAALTLAAKKGVDVRIILPHIPDKKYAFALAKSHYAQLTEAGVKIYEYTPGFIHSKVFLSDGNVGVVGTVNLDYRSLYLHYECAVYLQDVPALNDIARDFENTFVISRLITANDIKNEKLGTKLAGKLLKIIAPLM